MNVPKMSKSPFRLSMGVQEIPRMIISNMVMELREREKQLMGQIDLFHAIKEVPTPSKDEEKSISLFKEISRLNQEVAMSWRSIEDRHLIVSCDLQIVNLREERDNWKSRALLAEGKLDKQSAVSPKEGKDSDTRNSENFQLPRNLHQDYESPELASLSRISNVYSPSETWNGNGEFNLPWRGKEPVHNNAVRDTRLGQDESSARPAGEEQNDRTPATGAEAQHVTFNLHLSKLYKVIETSTRERASLKHSLSLDVGLALPSGVEMNALLVQILIALKRSGMSFNSSELQILSIEPDTWSDDGTEPTTLVVMQISSSASALHNPTQVIEELQQQLNDSSSALKNGEASQHLMRISHQ
ncbi:hypothetical protein GUITHDRAFT_109576 [Guillardia theta CCMP2712]|uniref:Uncharacterized protein n=1 Tax=Guillardia theta (strain CCMP2712) TaxID=905079 RepID=L1J7D8_GUITC|nr:hypothetical protein GUITHDRAFT_109576 [Guillardia theta CCMP2712]EKX44453.1 hypothetical protein GUITHDRAFT_109576 [Guillardia theta CCMP2712]|eukprot:XP_005831433.1 hypothetical protein GUITHDRAFT_109576 [Guillardia theta CCMP2712]